MKHYLIIILLSLYAETSFGQSMFFDNLNNSVWTSNAELNDSVIRFARPIGLQKFYRKEYIKKNVTIWTFKDGILTIQYFDIIQQKYNLLATYKYQFDKKKIKWKLNIILNDNYLLSYDVGIVATGTYAELTRTKQKKKKK